MIHYFFDIVYLLSLFSSVFPLIHMEFNLHIESSSSAPLLQDIAYMSYT